MGIDVGPIEATDGLVVHFDAGNIRSYAGSGNTIYSLSGFGYTGSLVNGPGFSSAHGGSFFFDGTNDYIFWNSLDSLKWQNWTQMTIEIVFMLSSYTGASGARQYILDFRDNGGVNGALGLFFDNAAGRGLKLFYNTTGTNFEELAITDFSLGEKIFYQVTFDKSSSSNNINHYINGNNVFIRSIAINSATSNTGRIWMGRYSGDNYFWNGHIYSFKFYNKLLSASEIFQNYHATKGRYK